MSHIQTYQPGALAKLARNPFAIALVAGLALAGCSKKNKLDSASDLGLNGANSATPGSPQDFTVNVGDRIFFDTDSSSIRPDAGQTLDRQAQWLNQYPNYRITVEGMPTNAAPANTTSRSALAAPKPRATTSPRAASPPTACAPFPTARKSRRGLRRHFLLVAEPSRRHRA